MSVPLVESSMTLMNREWGESPPRSRAILRSFAPLIATALALMAHAILPNRQTTLPTFLYPALLSFLLACSLVIVSLRSIWRRARPWVDHFGPLLAGAIFWLAVWDLVTRKMGWLPLPYFPGPDRVLQGLWDDRLLLAESTFQSLRLLIFGYALGVMAGVMSGVFIGWSRRARYWGMPVLKLVGPIPATAYVPLAMVISANAFVSGGVLIALAVWFPMTMLTASGIANVPLSYLDVAKTLGAGRGYLIFRVALPAALPSIFLGLFMGLGAAFLTLMVAETVGVSAGLGYYLKWRQGYLEYAKVYAALVIMAVFFSGLMTLLFKVRDRVLGWQRGVIRW